MLLVLRPFKVGDTITVVSVTGKVESIELFSTRVDTPDNRRVILPNAQIFGSVIDNQTTIAPARSSVTLGVRSPSTNTEVVRATPARLPSPSRAASPRPRPRPLSTLSALPAWIGRSVSGAPRPTSPKSASDSSSPAKPRDEQGASPSRSRRPTSPPVPGRPRRSRREGGQAPEAVTPPLPCPRRRGISPFGPNPIVSFISRGVGSRRLPYPRPVLLGLCPGIVYTPSSHPGKRTPQPPTEFPPCRAWPFVRPALASCVREWHSLAAPESPWRLACRGGQRPGIVRRPRQVTILVVDKSTTRRSGAPDANGDGVITNDATGESAWFDGSNAAGTPNFGNFAAFNVRQSDNLIIAGDVTNHRYCWLKDLDHNGDAQGATESRIILTAANASGASLSSSPTGNGFFPNGDYMICNSGSASAPDAVPPATPTATAF